MGKNSFAALLVVSSLAVATLNVICPTVFSVIIMLVGLFLAYASIKIGSDY
jgi:uncharacterized protein YqgC (DUF456 family)